MTGPAPDFKFNGAVPKARHASEPRREWRSFPADTILISSAGYAHLPGACDHLYEELVTAPSWGWIPDPSPGLWDRLSHTYPAAATGGNTARKATKRCSTCQAAVS